MAAAAAFLVGVDTTAVSVALPGIGRDLAASLGELQATVTAFALLSAALLSAALLTASGVVADRIGRRRVFGVGAVVFAIASGLCAVGGRARGGAGRAGGSERGGDGERSGRARGRDRGCGTRTGVGHLRRGGRVVVRGRPAARRRAAEAFVAGFRLVAFVAAVLGVLAAVLTAVTVRDQAGAALGRAA